MIDADTTNAAVIAMRKPSVSRKMRSGDMVAFSYPPLEGEGQANSHPVHRDRNLRPVLDGLIDHAIALGEFQQQVEFVLRGVSVDIEAQADFREADRGFLVDAERAAKIQIAFGGDVAC